MRGIPRRFPISVSKPAPLIMYNANRPSNAGSGRSRHAYQLTNFPFAVFL